MKYENVTFGFFFCSGFVLMALGVCCVVLANDV